MTCCRMCTFVCQSDMPLRATSNIPRTVQSTSLETRRKKGEGSLVANDALNDLISALLGAITLTLDLMLFAGEYERLDIGNNALQRGQSILT